MIQIVMQASNACQAARLCCSKFAHLVDYACFVLSISALLVQLLSAGVANAGVLQRTYSTYMISFMQCSRKQ